MFKKPHTPAPSDRSHAPGKIRAADVRAGIAVIRRATFKTALVAGPFPLSRMRAGNSKKGRGHHFWRGHEPQRIELLFAGDTAGGQVRNFDEWKRRRVFFLEIKAARDARSAARRGIGAGALSEATSKILIRVFRY